MCARDHALAMMPVPPGPREGFPAGTISGHPTTESSAVTHLERTGRTALGLSLSLAALLALPAGADDSIAPAGDAGTTQPLWEVGVAAAAGAVPDYPASDRYRARLIPFPYFVYRGRLFRSDENGARLRTDVRPNVELDISGGASFSTHSDASGPRAGMPDLNYLLELGPNLKITLARPSADSRWLLQLPLRAVASANGLHWGYQGLIFDPDVGIQTRALLGSRWSAYAAVGPEFASARFQQYFYQVEPQYALPDRPAYQAHGGYFGSRLELGVSHKLGKDFRLFFYSRLDDHSGARSEDSPLFKAHLDYTAFAGLSWAFWHSKSSVMMPPDAP